MVLLLLVSLRFQVLFHSPPGVLFTFPSRYCPLSVNWEYLALEGGPPVFPQGFSCLVVFWIIYNSLAFRLRDFYPLWFNFPDHSTRPPIIIELLQLFFDYPKHLYNNICRLDTV